MNILWLDLLNSDWHDYKGKRGSEDRLFQESWLKKFISPWQESLRSVPVKEIQKRLKGLRSLLRRMTDDFAQKKRVGKKDLESLNDILHRSPVIKKIIQSANNYLWKQETGKTSIHTMLSDIASSFAEALVSGESDRIKTCQNPDCLWIFYDNSKNLSRKWCENATGCGNMMKVRKHRAKKKK